ncbi:hypothetical protein DH2020_028702 [Rehmannia glutinosa]|uniref:Uncharacterized protein n=1 Tax=Rehmannia glutinosa TaxID=99300 RepID=A0ABR0VUU2_REHGL
MKKEDQARSLLGISLTDKPIWQQFLICSSGFFFGYLVNGICEGFTTKQMVNPWKTYVKLSAVLMGSHGLTKGSLAYLNYPAQIMFKSTKVLPVMVMGAFIPGLRRKYPVHEYISALLLVLGLILFTLADANTSPNFSVIGIVMILGALVMDAFLGNLQEAIFTMNPDTTQHPYVYGVLVFEAMATFVGQVSVLSLIALFGAATTAMVTTARKAVTLLLSYLIFTKPLTEQHGSGLILIAMGIVLKLVLESKPPSRVVTPDSTSTRGNSYSKEVNNRGKGNGDGGEEDEEKRPLV